VPIVRKSGIQYAEQHAEQPRNLRDHPDSDPYVSADRIQRRWAWQANRLRHWPEADTPRAPPTITALDVDRPLITANSIIVPVQ
jgi:hypothetical protein